MKAGGKIMIESILTKATEDTYFKPFPHNLRQRLKTRIVIVNEIPKKYLCKKICDLDFWNDISGFITTIIMGIRLLTRLMGKLKSRMM